MNSKTIKVALAGAGAFGIKHLDGIKNIDGVEVVSVIGRDLDKTQMVAKQYGIRHVGTDLADALAPRTSTRSILCTPTQMHADQSVACLKAGKHVQVEIPLADTLDGARGRRSVCRRRPGWSAMVGHTRRFNPSSPVDPQPDRVGRAQHPADGRADVFLPSHEHERARPAALVDRSPAVASRRAHRRPVRLPDRRGEIVQANAIQGPIHPTLGIAMDMSIQLKSSTGAICTLSLSFNNDGPLGTFFRYIWGQRHLHRALRRPVRRQGREDRRVARSTYR